MANKARNRAESDWGDAYQAAQSQEKTASGGRILPALCNVLGVLMLLVAVGLCVPLTAPLLAGYQVIGEVGGSMKPEIPAGSVVYVKAVDPIEIQDGEIIAYQEGENAIVHRVVSNRISSSDFVTKGDANAAQDVNPVPYEAVIGRVEGHVPMLGMFTSIYESVAGKVYIVLTIMCGIMLNMVASSMRKTRRKDELRQELESRYAGAGGNTGYSRSSGNYARHGATGSSRRTSKPPSRLKGFLKGMCVVVLAVAFLGSAGVIGYVNWQYAVSDSLYNDASDKYLEEGKTDGSSADSDAKPPITVDFDALCAANPDVVGWIYCPGTVINYPVLQGEDDDDYLYRDYTGAYNIDGSIFVDSRNLADFVDSNTIIYGHHMNSGSMFATLERWGEQAYYKDHPMMWLLTPTQDYKIMLFSSHHVNAYSTMYQMIREPGEELGAYLGEALAESDLHANAQLDSTLARYAAIRGVDLSQAQIDESAPFVLLDSESHYVMLSTCAYLFEDDRYVLHGKLVPVETAGGKAKK